MNKLEHIFTREISGIACFDLPTRVLYASDASIYQILPSGVLFPRDEEDLLRIVEIAANEKLELIPRGGGSGIAGEALGRGIVVEFSRFMNRIVGIEDDGETVAVEPGAILDSVNSCLAGRGLMIGPDPSSSSRATLGGMVANDATGAHSILYGHTRHHLKSLDLVLADGNTATLKRESLEKIQAKKYGSGILGDIFFTLPRLFEESRDLIAADSPATERDRSGYHLAGVVRDGFFNPHLLIAGSEGTLAFVSRIRIGTVKKPAFKKVLLLLFHECLQATDAVVPILGYGPSAVEMIDGMMIELARKASRDYDRLLPTAAGACLLVECAGENEDELVARLDSIRSAIVEKERLAFGSLMSSDQSKEAKIWELRKAGVPLLFRRPGDEQPVPFIEDVAVPVERLSGYVSRLSSIFEKYGVKAAFYGHAGGGELHIRPYLNLRSEKDVEVMERIAGETFVLVRELGGSLSGEHGEGLVRGQFIRRMHPYTWPLFLQIKKTFDPRGMFNPDKIVVDDNRLMVKNLRFGSPYKAESPGLRLNYKEQSYADIVERCNGCGECRSLEQYSMCPVFKETLLEAASPRAKANVLRNLLYGKVSEDIEFARAWKEIYDYCIACGMCRVECPSGVDIPRLMAEAKIRYAEKNGLSLTDLFLSEAQMTCSVMSLFAPLVNMVNRNKAARLVIEWLTGIDRRRKLPKFSLPGKKALRRNFAKGSAQPRVALFRDLFASYNDPALGRTVVTLLEELLGAEVVVPDLGSCGITAMVYGNRKTALSQVKDNIAILSGLVDDGFVVVSQEPTSVLSLKKEYPDWVDSEEAGKIAGNTFELFQYLSFMEEAGIMRPLSVSAGLGMKLVYHAPCHLKALDIGRPSQRFLSRIPGLEIVESYAACCGIAGTFGMKASHYDLSLRIGRRIFEKLADQSVAGGLSECSTCRMQMESHGKPSYHPAELLAHALGIGKLRSPKALDKRIATN